MKKNFLICGLLVFIFITFGYMAQALPATIKINENSPLFPQFGNMLKIYSNSCQEGINGNILDENMPMLANDRLDDKFRSQYPKVPNFYLHVLVFAGFDLGRALQLTDLGGDDMEQVCKRYSLNFVATINNGATIQAGSDAYPPPSVTTSNVDGSSIFNDWLRRKDGDRIALTPQASTIGACGYMYSVYARNPVIQLGPLDATLDMMVDMLFNNYNREDIRHAYPYLIDGATRGAYLFQNHQDIKLCK